MKRFHPQRVTSVLMQNIMQNFIKNAEDEDRGAHSETVDLTLKRKSRKRSLETAASVSTAVSGSSGNNYSSSPSSDGSLPVGIKVFCQRECGSY